MHDLISQLNNYLKKFVPISPLYLGLSTAIQLFSQPYDKDHKKGLRIENQKLAACDDLLRQTIYKIQGLATHLSRHSASEDKVEIFDTLNRTLKILQKISKKDFTNLTADELEFIVKCFPATEDDSINNDLLYAIWSIFRNIDSTNNQNPQTVTFDFETNKNALAKLFYWAFLENRKNNFNPIRYGYSRENDLICKACENKTKTITFAALDSCNVPVGLLTNSEVDSLLTEKNTNQAIALLASYRKKYELFQESKLDKKSFEVCWYIINADIKDDFTLAYLCKFIAAPIYAVEFVKKLKLAPELEQRITSYLYAASVKQFEKWTDKDYQELVQADPPISLIIKLLFYIQNELQKNPEFRRINNDLTLELYQFTSRQQITSILNEGLDKVFTDFARINQKSYADAKIKITSLILKALSSSQVMFNFAKLNTQHTILFSYLLNLNAGYFLNENKRPYFINASNEKLINLFLGEIISDKSYKDLIDDLMSILQRSMGEAKKIRIQNLFLDKNQVGKLCQHLAEILKTNTDIVDIELVDNNNEFLQIKEQLQQLCERNQRMRLANPAMRRVALEIENNNNNSKAWETYLDESYSTPNLDYYDYGNISTFKIDNSYGKQGLDETFIFLFREAAEYQKNNPGSVPIIAHTLREQTFTQQQLYDSKGLSFYDFINSINGAQGKLQKEIYQEFKIPFCHLALTENDFKGTFKDGYELAAIILSIKTLIKNNSHLSLSIVLKYNGNDNVLEKQAKDQLNTLLNDFEKNKTSNQIYIRILPSKVFDGYEVAFTDTYLRNNRDNYAKNIQALKLPLIKIPINHKKRNLIIPESWKTHPRKLFVNKPTVQTSLQANQGLRLSTSTSQQQHISSLTSHLTNLKNQLQENINQNIVTFGNANLDRSEVYDPNNQDHQNEIKRIINQVQNHRPYVANSEKILDQIYKNCINPQIGQINSVSLRAMKNMAAHYDYFIHRINPESLPRGLIIKLDNQQRKILDYNQKLALEFNTADDDLRPRLQRHKDVLELLGSEHQFDENRIDSSGNILFDNYYTAKEYYRYTTKTNDIRKFLNQYQGQIKVDGDTPAQINNRKSQIIQKYQYIFDAINKYSVQTNANQLGSLISILFKYGLKGLEDFLGQLENINKLHPQALEIFMKVYLAKYNNWLQFFEDSELINYIKFLNMLTPNQLAWWNALHKQQYDDIARFYPSEAQTIFTAFLNKIQNLGLQLPDEPNLQQAQGFQTALGKIIESLNNSLEKQIQLNEIAQGLSLAAHSGVGRVAAGQFKFVCHEMDNYLITDQPIPATINDLIQDNEDNNILTGKVYCYISQQKFYPPLDYIRQIIKRVDVNTDANNQAKSLAKALVAIGLTKDDFDTYEIETSVDTILLELTNLDSQTYERIKEFIRLFDKAEIKPNLDQIVSILRYLKTHSLSSAEALSLLKNGNPAAGFNYLLNFILSALHLPGQSKDQLLESFQATQNQILTVLKQCILDPDTYTKRAQEILNLTGCLSAFEWNCQNEDLEKLIKNNQLIDFLKILNECDTDQTYKQNLTQNRISVSYLIKIFNESISAETKHINIDNVKNKLQILLVFKGKSPSHGFLNYKQHCQSAFTKVSEVSRSKNIILATPQLIELAGQLKIDQRPLIKIGMEIISSASVQSALGELAIQLKHALESKKVILQSDIVELIQSTTENVIKRSELDQSESETVNQFSSLLQTGLHNYLVYSISEEIGSQLKALKLSSKCFSFFHAQLVKYSYSDEVGRDQRIQQTLDLLKLFNQNQSVINPLFEYLTKNNELDNFEKILSFLEKILPVDLKYSIKLNLITTLISLNDDAQVKNLIELTKIVTAKFNTAPLISNQLMDLMIKRSTCSEALVTLVSINSNALKSNLFSLLRTLEKISLKQNLPDAQDTPLSDNQYIQLINLLSKLDHENCNFAVYLEYIKAHIINENSDELIVDVAYAKNLEQLLNPENAFLLKSLTPEEFSSLVKSDKIDEAITQKINDRFNRDNTDWKRLLQKGAEPLSLYEINFNRKFSAKNFNDLLEQINDIALAKAISAKSTLELTQEIHSLRDLFTKKDLNAVKQTLALLRELHYRCCVNNEGKGKFPNYTQMATLLYGTLYDHHAQFGIDTGEGKSIAIAMQAAISYLKGKTVDVCTATETLAERDYYNCKTFLNTVGAETVLIDQDADLNIYQPNKIYFSTLTNLSFLRMRHQISNKFQHFQKSILDLVALIDESDEAELDTTSEFILPKIISDNESQENPFTKLYPYINYFVDFIDRKATDIPSLQSEYIKYCIRQECPDYDENAQPPIVLTMGQDIQALYNYLTLSQGIDDNARAALEKLSDAELPAILNRWITSSRTARFFATEQKQAYNIHTLKDGVNSGKKFAIINNKSDYPMPQARWGNGVQQLLHARLEANKENPNTYVYEPETMILGKMNNRAAIRFYQNKGQVYSYTASPGDDSEINEVLREFGINTIKLSRHFENKLKPQPAKLCENYYKQAEAIVAVIKKSPKRPIVILCANKESLTKLSNEILKLLPKDKKDLFQQLSSQDILDPQQKTKKEQEFLDKAKIAGMISISTLTKRGTDIDASIDIVRTHIGSSREYTQEKGRGGRSGKEGKMYEFFNAEEIKAEFHFDPFSMPLAQLIETVRNTITSKEAAARYQEYLRNEIDYLFQRQFKLWVKEAKDEDTVKQLTELRADALEKLDYAWLETTEINNTHFMATINAYIEKVTGIWTEMHTNLPDTFNTVKQSQFSEKLQERHVRRLRKLDQSREVHYHDKDETNHKAIRSNLSKYKAGFFADDRKTQKAAITTYLEESKESLSMVVNKFNESILATIDKDIEINKKRSLFKRKLNSQYREILLKQKALLVQESWHKAPDIGVLLHQELKFLAGYLTNAAELPNNYQLSQLKDILPQLEDYNKNQLKDYLAQTAKLITVINNRGDAFNAPHYKLLLEPLTTLFENTIQQNQAGMLITADAGDSIDQHSLTAIQIQRDLTELFKPFKSSLFGGFFTNQLEVDQQFNQNFGESTLKLSTSKKQYLLETRALISDLLNQRGALNIRIINHSSNNQFEYQASFDLYDPSNTNLFSYICQFKFNSKIDKLELVSLEPVAHASMPLNHSL